MSRKAIIHIGPMKTGSSSIQAWLFGAAPRLLESGVHVLRAFGPNMSPLAALAFAELLGEPPVPSDQVRLDQARAELAALPDRVHTVVISGEMLGQQLHHPREVRALKAILGDSCDAYRIVTYLRRQDELSTSLYSTALRRGQRNARKLTRPFDYHAMLTAWSRVFGEEAIVPRIFDRASLVGGDVVRDFADAAGLPYEPVAIPDISRNLSLRADAQQFLLDLKRRTVADGVDGPLAGFGRMDEINRILNRDYTGKGAQPTRAQAAAFVAAAAEGNEAVRRAWFPDRATLFDDDFSSYPEREPDPPSPQAVLDVALAVLSALVVQQDESPGRDRDAKARDALSTQMRERRRQRAQGRGRTAG